MAVPVEKREEIARQLCQPLADKMDEDTLEYVIGAASSVLQDADSRQEAESELDEALAPHLEAASVDDPNALVKALLDAVWPPKKEAPAAKAGAKAKGKPTNGAKEPEEGALVVKVDNLILMYGGSQKPLLANTGFELRKGHRYGVVGHNGAGKTTLMSRVATGNLQGMEKKLNCYHLAHEGILENVDRSLSCTQYLKRSVAADDDAIAKAMDEVGFTEAMASKAIGELSGGWKMRLALASATMQGADVYLLDEPTNHLDSVAVKWLQEYLVKDGRRSTSMIISHDAAFLNYVCTDIVHFTPQGKLVYHEGNFDHFQKKTKLDADGARGMLEGAGEATEDSSARPGAADDDEEMKFPLPGKIEGLGTSTKPVATVTNLNFRYFEDQPLVLKDVTVRLTMNSRVGVVGRNGAGKSTLLNLLAGELIPPEDEAGEVSAVWRHRNLRLAYIAQQHFFHLAEFYKSTPLHYIQTRFRHGWDEETQKRLTLPQTPEEEQYRKEMAAQHGKRGREVERLESRRKMGKKIMYEVRWKGLDDAKQNTYESVQKLRLLGVEKMAAALDDRLACQETALRPLSTREIVKHLEPFGITEEMTTHRMIGSFSAGQKSKLTLGAAMWTRPHVVAFDEPTNYLDFSTVRALQRAIKLFRGGIIVVSHNEDFLKEVAEEIWQVQDGQVKIVGKEGIPKNLHAKNEAARQAKERSRLDAGVRQAAKNASGPSDAEKALQIYLQARQKLGAPKADIKLQSIDLRALDGSELLLGTDFTINQGRRYGLVGRNGAGKSTLLREIAYYRLDKFPKNLKVLLVEQEITGTDQKPVEWVLGSDVERTLLFKEQKELQDAEDSATKADRLKQISDRLEEIGALDAEARVTRILKGLQFTEELLATPTSSLSGGWRMRVSLASALFAQPELLLLDEPTNHLDFPAVLWLEEYLQSFKNTAIIVSHDRGFLNNTVTDIVFLNGKKLAYYKGTYETFRDSMQESRLAQQRAFDTQQAEIAHIMEFINKHDNRPKIVAQKESKKKMLDKMEKIEDPAITYADSSSLSIRFPAPGPLPKNELIRLDDVTFGYEGRPALFANTTVNVDIKGRVGILGANGAGKSTLLKVMQGQLTPTKGSCTVNKSMRVGSFAQHHVEALDVAATCVDCVQGKYPGMSDQDARGVLGKFGISGDIALRTIRTLSGGQKSRVALAIITYSKPHLLYLDEPTNHLDMETIDTLIEAIQHFEGCVVMVSHDQYFLSKLAKEFWSVSAGKVRVFRDIDEAKAASYKRS